MHIPTSPSSPDGPATASNVAEPTAASHSPPAVLSARARVPPATPRTPLALGGTVATTTGTGEVVVHVGKFPGSRNVGTLPRHVGARPRRAVAEPLPLPLSEFSSDAPYTGGMPMSHEWRTGGVEGWRARMVDTEPQPEPVRVPTLTPRACDTLARVLLERRTRRGPPPPPFVHVDDATMIYTLRTALAVMCVDGAKGDASLISRRRRARR